MESEPDSSHLFFEVVSKRLALLTPSANLSLTKDREI